MSGRIVISTGHTSKPTPLNWQACGTPKDDGGVEGTTCATPSSGSNAPVKALNHEH